jgi:MFS family permease
MDNTPSDPEKQSPPASTTPIPTHTTQTPKPIDPEATAPGYTAPPLIKWLVVLATSFAALTASFSSTSMFSAASEIATEFHTTPDLINASSAGVLVTMGLSNFFWGPLIPLCGRLYTWNSCLVACLAWTLAASFSSNLGYFIAFRLLSGLQGTFFHITGQAIIAEFFPPVRRGNATGMFLCGTVLGPPLGPLVAGVITTFTTWRVILWVQCGMLGFALGLSLLCLGKGGKNATVTNPSLRDVARVYNPWQVLRMFRYPNVLLADFAAGLLSWSQYSLLASPRHILETQYGLDSPLTSGLFYLAPAAGFLAGTIIGGRFSDRTVRKWISKRNGLRLPQDRLRSGFISLFFVLPASSLIYGWCLDQRAGGLPLAVVFSFIIAGSVLAAFAGLNTYCAEVMPHARQQAIASKYVVQYAFSAAASGATIPLVNAVGVGWQCTVGVVMALCAGGVCLTTAKWGLRMQMWVEGK